MLQFTNPTSEGIWKDRYCKNCETLEHNLNRVASYCANSITEKELFMEVMSKGYFFPAGRTMSNSGIGESLTLNNCFVAPQIDDSLDDIFSKVKLGAMTHQRGGGIGYDFSQIRPEGTPTSNDAIASGPVSFMHCFDTQTSTILQGGRRGANMGVLSVYHMDIEKFISAKSYDAGVLSHFNVSVMVDDDFMNAVKNDSTIHLHHPVYDSKGRIIKNADKWEQSREVSARQLWDKIMKQAYNNGEPGVFFYDNLNRDNNLSYIENIVCSNPCAEYLAGTVYGYSDGTKLNPQHYGGACNLGSVFLHNLVDNPFTKGARFNFKKLEQAVNTGVRFLDNVIDINNYPDAIYENYQKSFRTIGLGVTGLADMLVMLGVKYNSEIARQLVYELMNRFSFLAYKASINLAKEKGCFPLMDVCKFAKSGYLRKHVKRHPEWQEIIDGIMQYGIRNAKLLSIAPVGTLSLTFGNNCSSGIEPIFSLSYDRKVKVGGQSVDNIQIIPVRDYAYDMWLNTKEGNVVTEDKFITALEMSVDDHIDMLKQIAFHVDMSVSKTINVPSNYSEEETQHIYTKCWESGIKGCTIFRPNELRPGVLITKDDTQPSQINSVADISDLERGYIVQVDDSLVGRKRTIQSGCGKIHVCAYFDPATGDLMETFFLRGRKGGCNSLLIGLSRMISLAARGGVHIDSIIDQLDSCDICSAFRDRKKVIRDTARGVNCPSAIGNALHDMYVEFQTELGNWELEDETATTQAMCTAAKELLQDQPALEKTDKVLCCPECESVLGFEGGCVICRSCGYSKCN